MKNKTLVILISISILVFGGLIFSIYKMVNKDVPTFFESGYVSVSDFESSDKVYFEKGTTYKNAYNNNIVFKNSDKDKSEVSRYSFVLYNDKSISFLAPGVIMDLNKVNEAFTPYYNIKRDYIINYNGGKYVINATDKDIVLDDFIGRISDNKYIVAGNDLKLKLSSSEEFISGYYFELIFSEGNVVKIDNDKLNLETISDECYILVGDHIKIDLSHQAIYYDTEAKIALSEIIIDNDSNIDIAYEDIFGGGGAGEGDGDGEGGGAGDGEDNTTPEPEKPVITPEYKVETVVDYKKVPYVELTSSNANAHKISLKFKVIDENNLINSTVKVRLLNLRTGETSIKEYANYFGELDFIADSLMSNNSYMISILTSYSRLGTSYNDYVMFQRTFNTTDVGIELEKDYTTSGEISYNIKPTGDSTFTSAELNLYDSKGNLVESYAFDNDHSLINKVFSNLDSNTSYTAKIENISFGNVLYEGAVAVTDTQKTLKYNPFKDSLIETNPIATINKKDYNVKFDLGTLSDKDKSIKEVKYNIYDKETGEVVKTIERGDLNPISVKIENELEGFKTYYYNALITLNDGEKLIEFTSLNSNDFNMDNKISPSMRFVTTGVTANTIDGYFIIDDPDNTIDKEKDIYVEYVSSLGDSKRQNLEFGLCPAGESETTKCAAMYLEELKSSDIYTINLFSFVDLKDPNKEANYTAIGAIKLNTEKAVTINTDMSSKALDETESIEKVFELSLGLILPDGVPDEIAENLEGFDIMLYEGFDTTGMYISTVHITPSQAKDLFTNKKVLTIKDFGYSLEQLQKIHINNGKLSKAYSIRLRNAKSGSEYIEFKSDILNFEINDILLNLASEGATIELGPIYNNPNNAHYDKNLNSDTIIGIKATTEFGNKAYALNLNFQMFDVTNLNSIKTKEVTKMLDLAEGSPVPVTEFYFDEYPDFLKRGNTYYFKYTVSLDLNDDDKGDLEYPFSPDSIKIPAPVSSEEIDILKQEPSMVLFPWTSTSNSVTYKYEIKDVDKTLPDNYTIYYNLNDNELAGERLDTCSTLVSGYKTNFKCVKINELNNNDNYSILLNASLLNKSNSSFTKIPINDFTFESIYSSLDGLSYNLELKEDNTSLYTNVLSLKISEPYDELDAEAKKTSEELKRRVAYYTLQIEGPDGSKFVFDNINDITRTVKPFGANIIKYTGKRNITWDSRTNKDSTYLRKAAYIDDCVLEEGICLYLDYSKIYKSETFKEVFAPYKNADIKVSLKATYDTGKVAYLSSPQANYNVAFKVVSSKEIKKGSTIYNNLYFKTVTGNINYSSFTPSNLGAAYAYLPIARYGFVDDSVDDNKGPYGKMTFINVGYTNLSTTSSNVEENYFLNLDYEITNRGVEIKYQKDGNISLPIVATALGETTLNGGGTFIFDKVVPALNIISQTSTVNGSRLAFSLSGLTDDDVKEENGNRYLYLEVYDEEENLIKTIKINKDELTSQSGIILNKKYTLKVDGDYKIDIANINIAGANVTDYNYDYETGVITFNGNIPDNTAVTINYRQIIDGLNPDSTYVLKAFMYMGNKGEKTYLTDSATSTYDPFARKINTKKIENVKVTNAKTDIESLSDYKTRYLNISYILDDIIGFSNISYEVCNADKTVCAEDIMEVKDNCYNTFEGTCISRNGYFYSSSYTLNSDFDISISDKLDFKFNTDYNVVIKGNVKTEDGNKDYIIYNGNLNVRDLNNPEVNVVKSSRHKTDSTSGNIKDNYYLTFDVSFKDDDRVIVSPIDSLQQNGYYVAYLAAGPERIKVTENLVDKDGKALPTEQIIEIAPGGQNKTQSLSYGYLDPDSEYYLMVEYRTYRNNGVNTGPELFRVPYLIYTLDDNDISVGMIDYNALKNSSILKFGYATNIVKDDRTDENGNLIQEAYVAGISYTIRRTSGDDTFSINGNKIFSDGEVKYITDGSTDSKVGESYYQITLDNTNYPAETFYKITFKFYLGGRISSHLTTEEACMQNSITNHWNNAKNECYILGNKTYDASSLYGGV